MPARAGWAARLNRLPADLAADLAHLEQGQLGDAAEIWAGHLAPSTGLDHLGDEIWVIDEPEDVAAAADFLWSQADERRAELEKAGDPAQDLARRPTPAGATGSSA